MYYIIDLTSSSPLVVPNLQFSNEIDAIDWINNNGNATMYTIMSSL
jgi:hypothetical protein